MPRKSPTIKVSPSVLTWARESAGITLPAAAKRLGTSLEAVAAFEAGEKEPTLRALEILAVFYKRSLAAILLPEPPPEPPTPTDFRVLPGGKRSPLTKKTRLIIRRAQRLQARAGDLLEEMNAGAQIHIPRAALGADPEQLAASERDRLGIPLNHQFGWRDPYAAFRAWRAVIERLGALVFHFSIPMQDTRGFSLTDRDPPVIVVNRADAIKARIFTLFHEYAHLILHDGGLCTWDQAFRHDVIPTECFCNHFAGAFLVPRSALHEFEFLRSRPRAQSLEESELASIANQFKVSKDVVWRRMRICGFISRQAYESRLEAWQDTKPKNKRKWRPPTSSAARRALEERGRRFSSLVIGARARDLITTRDVLDFLSIPPASLRELQSAVRVAEKR